jgi:hypothetical protein
MFGLAASLTIMSVHCDFVEAAEINFCQTFTQNQNLNQKIPFSSPISNFQG